MTRIADSDRYATNALMWAHNYVSDYADHGGKGDARAIYFALVAIAYRLDTIACTLADLVNAADGVR